MKPEESQALLQYIHRHIELSEEQYQHLLSKTKRRSYRKGQHVLQGGDVCRHLSFVLKGSLKVGFLDTDGKEHIIMLPVENWWVADLGSFTDQTPADFDIQCLEHTRLAQLSLESLEQLFQDIPQLERFFRIIILRAFIFSQRRITDNLSLSAKERYLKFRQEYPQIEQRVPQYLIASYLGMSKEFLSKIRSQLSTGQVGD